jgi:hypothetical protein
MLYDPDAAIDCAIGARYGDRVDIGPFELSFTGATFERAERTGNVRLIGRNLTRTVPSANGAYSDPRILHYTNGSWRLEQTLPHVKGAVQGITRVPGTDS